MKIYFSIFIFLLSFQSYSFDYIFRPDRMGEFDSLLMKENRAIEATSPILGHALVTQMKESSEHPEVIYQKALTSNPLLYPLLQISAKSYLEALLPGLREYCSKEHISTVKRAEYTILENAAIPQDILFPFVGNYLERLNSNLTQGQTLVINESTVNIGDIFQSERYQCPVVKKLQALEKRVEKYCLGFKFCLKASKVHHIISSAEASYPRTQFSINGFTRYVYNQLLKVKDLDKKLKFIFDTEILWIKNHKKNIKQEEFFQFVVEKSLDRRMHPKEIFLILAYSMRNMPSLDIEYTKKPLKAFLLETYFWQFKKIRNELYQSEYLPYVFPRHKFKRNPGFYHYLTAVLTGCEGRLSDLSHFTSTMMGLFSKLGYKIHKLTKAIDKDYYHSVGFFKKWKYLKGIMKRQGFWVGVEAGLHGAKYGSRACKGYMRKIKKMYKSEYKGDELKNLLRKEYRSVLDEEDFQ